MVPLAVAELRRVRAGPGQEDGAVGGVVGRHRERGHGERVGQDHGESGIAAGHLLLAVDPHQPPPPYRLGDRDRRAERHPLPRRGEGPRQPRDDRHLQDRLVGRQQVHGARVGPDVVHHRGQRQRQQRMTAVGGVDRRPLPGRVDVRHPDHLLARPRDGPRVKAPPWGPHTHGERPAAEDCRLPFIGSLRPQRRAPSSRRTRWSWSSSAG